MTGFEPALLSELEPKSSASASFATSPEIVSGLSFVVRRTSTTDYGQLTTDMVEKQYSRLSMVGLAACLGGERFGLQANADRADVAARFGPQRELAGA